MPQLAALDGTTIERGADFAKFHGAEIIVPREPVLDGSGELDINGLIVAAARERVAFRAGFERERGTLRLINLLVARSRPVSP